MHCVETKAFAVFVVARSDAAKLFEGACAALFGVVHFRLIDDGLGSQVVTWRPALEQRLGQQVLGVMTATGLDWDFARKRGPSR